MLYTLRLSPQIVQGPKGRGLGEGGGGWYLDPSLPVFMSFKMSALAMVSCVPLVQVECEVCHRHVELDIFYRAHIASHQLREEEYLAKESWNISVLFYFSLSEVRLYSKVFKQLCAQDSGGTRRILPPPPRHLKRYQ